ncbi:MAG: MAPEG family protein [Pseudomonadota bacterium]
MSPTAVALLGFVAWTLLILMSLGAFRSAIVMNGKRAANSFNPSGADLEGFGQRLTRVHANCYESLPIAGAVLLYAIATNQTALTDPLAYLFLAARIAQSAVHMISTSNLFVFIRFGFFGVQLAVLSWWLVKLSGLV